MALRLVLAITFVASGACASTAVAPPSPSVSTAPRPATPDMTVAPSSSALVMPDACGMLTRTASDGAQRSLDVVANGTTTRYRVAGPGVAPSDIGAANTNAVPVRITGRRLPPASGMPDAVNVTDFAVTYVDSCAPAPAPYAIACGTVTEFVGNTPFAYGSLVLVSPGRAPLKIVLTSLHSTPGGGIGGSACVGMVAGSPLPVFGGVSAVVPAAAPQTRASPAPVGFELPRACAYVAPPEVGPDQTVWRFSCGPDADGNARGSLGSALTQQGWTSCGPALATEAWIKAGVRLTVVESSRAPGDHPRFSQTSRTASC